MASPESGFTGPIYFRSQRASGNGANPHNAQTLFLRSAHHVSRSRRLGRDGHAAWRIEHIGNALNQPGARYTFDRRQVRDLSTRCCDTERTYFTCSDQRLKNGNDDIAVSRVLHLRYGARLLV